MNDFHQEQLFFPGGLMIEIQGNSKTSVGQSIWFTEVTEGRDKGLWSCGKCNVNFYADWRIKHVNWHYRTRRLDQR